MRGWLVLSALMLMAICFMGSVADCGDCHSEADAHVCDCVCHAPCANFWVVTEAHEQLTTLYLLTPSVAFPPSAPTADIEHPPQIA